MSVFKHADRILELFDEGYSMRAIHAELGCGIETVRSVLIWNRRPVPTSGKYVLKRNKEPRRGNG